MEYLFEIMSLSPKFYEKYNFKDCPEILYKQKRSYNCLLIDLYYDYFICIPFRSNIRHNDAYLFKSSIRSKKSRSGLDYQKMVIIEDIDMFSTNIAIVDQDEYREMVEHMDKIVFDAAKYLEKYIKHINKIEIIHPKEFLRHYRYSSLRYFHDVLKSVN